MIYLYDMWWHSSVDMGVWTMATMGIPRISWSLVRWPEQNPGGGTIFNHFLGAKKCSNMFQALFIYIYVRNELRTVFLRRFMAYILVGIFWNCSYVWMGWNHFEPTDVHGGRWGKQFSYRHQQQLPVAPQAGTRNTVTAWTNMWRVGQTTRPRR